MSRETSPGPVSAEAAWTEARARAERAVESGAPPERVTFELLGEPVRVTAGSASLATRLTAAMSHLPGTALDPGSSAGLEVYAWDAGSTGVDLRVDVDGDGPTRYGFEDETEMTGLAGGRWVHFDQASHTALMDRRSRRVLVCFEDADLAHHVRAKPLAKLLRVWAGDLGHNVMHAGAVARDDRCVLVAGDSGAGKTTACLRAWLDGMTLLGDDNVALVEEDGHEVAHSLYCSTRVESGHLDSFPELEAQAQPSPDPDDPKHLVLLDEVGVGRLKTAARVGGLVIPTVRPGRPTRLRPLSAGVALRELTPEFVLMSHGDRRTAFDRLGTLIADVPTVRLELGTDLHRLPDLLTSVLDGELPDDTDPADSERRA